MTILKINHEVVENGILPTFSIDISASQVKSIYSDVDLQNQLAHALRKKQSVTFFDFQEGLYERLTVQENIKFYQQWFACPMSIPEILVTFELLDCAKTPLSKCSESEIRRVYYAKHYMTGKKINVFQEPISNVDIKTMNCFIHFLKQLIHENRLVLLLVSSMEHALLLSDFVYHLQDEGLHQLETESEAQEIEAEKVPSTSPIVEKLFKIPAKVEDKVILFDPTEIDYIESQEGKSFIVINNDSFALDLTLTEIEKKLEWYGYFRCHRSYIVNLQKVREIITWSKNTYSLKINNKVQATIPLSRTKLQTIQKIFNLK